MAKFYGDADIPAMHAEFGVPVIFQLIEGYGLLDVQDEESFPLDGAILVGKTRRLRLHTNTFKDVKTGSLIVIDGIEHNVVATRQIADGAETDAYVVPA